jgi:hypothetical protein
MKDLLVGLFLYLWFFIAGIMFVLFVSAVSEFGIISGIILFGVGLVLAFCKYQSEN